jgi:hypothetical protein
MQLIAGVSKHQYMCGHQHACLVARSACEGDAPLEHASIVCLDYLTHQPAEPGSYTPSRRFHWTEPPNLRSAAAHQSRDGAHSN